MTMKLGALCFFTDESIAPGELAPALEHLGFESLWVGDHSHIPVDRDASGPPLDTRTGKPVPRHYARLVDPFLALTHAAAVTTTLRLGTSICLVNERDVIATAKQVATLDHLSGGRFLFGVGAGWNAQEMRDHGTDPSRRYTGLRERIEAMKTIWSADVAEYEGETVRFGPLLCWPKPVQRPHPPIYIGGNYRNIPRVVAYGDGWIPSTTVLPERAFLDQIGALQQHGEAAGRGTLPVTAIHVTAVDTLAPGTDDFTDEQWSAWAAAGVERAVLIVPPEGDRALRMAEHYSRFAQEANG